VVATRWAKLDRGCTGRGHRVAWQIRISSCAECYAAFAPPMLYIGRRSSRVLFGEPSGHPASSHWVSLDYTTDLHFCNEDSQTPTTRPSLVKYHACLFDLRFISTLVVFFVWLVGDRGSPADFPLRVAECDCRCICEVSGRGLRRTSVLRGEKSRAYSNGSACGSCCGGE